MRDSKPEASLMHIRLSVLWLLEDMVTLVSLVPLFGCLAICFSPVESLDDADIAIGRMNAEMRAAGSWIAGRTSKAGLAMAELISSTGARMPSLKDVMEDPYILPKPQTRISLPQHFDARQKWPKCTSISDISDQGKCAACWAFSGVNAITDRICIHDPNQNAVKKISVQDATVCAVDADPKTNLWWCHLNRYAEMFQPFLFSSNWFTVSPMKTFCSRGLVTGGEPTQPAVGCMPYTSFFKENLAKTNTLECKSVCTNKNYKIAYEKDKTFGSIYYSMGKLMGKANGGAAYEVRNESVVTQIMNEIMVNGPVSALLDVYADFFYYQSGVYEHKSGDHVGGHSLKLIGWGKENGKDYWMAVNSWGTGWGMNGFVKFLKGTDHLRIEQYVTTALPKKTKKPTNRDRGNLASDDLSQTSVKEGIFVPPIQDRPSGYNYCDALFCLDKQPGFFQVYPCSRNYCHCSKGQVTAYACPEGQIFDATNDCHVPDRSCSSSAGNTNVITELSGEISSKCNTINCRGRGESAPWFTLGQCSKYWCYCWPNTQRVQICPDGYLFDFRPETAKCVPHPQLPWC